MLGKLKSIFYGILLCFFAFNAMSIEVIRSAINLEIFIPVENDEEGIKRIYRELSSRVN